jgi:hypothetical protein
VYRVRGKKNQFVSAGLKEKYEVDELHVDISIVNGLELIPRPSHSGNLILRMQNLF